jgi:thiol-disulfide isomerase/thioredoxin
MKRTALFLLVLAVLTSAVAVVAESAATPAPTEGASAGAAAPMDSVIGAFSTVDIDGNAVDSNIFAENKLTMVNVWATFCPPCIEEIPHLAKLDEEIEGFQVLGVLGDAGTKDVQDPNNVALGQEIAEKSGAAYPSVLPDDTITAMLMNYITAFPTSFFVDQEGQIVGQAIVGSMSYDDWKKVIEQKLAEGEAA